MRNKKSLGLEIPLRLIYTGYLFAIAVFLISMSESLPI